MQGGIYDLIKLKTALKMYKAFTKLLTSCTQKWLEIKAANYELRKKDLFKNKGQDKY